jgi:hypothetical protein
MYPVMGVMQNPGIISAKVEQPNARTLTPDTSIRFNSKIAQIGWDWKIITVTPGAWPVRDSISYILKKGENQYFKIYFTDYYADQTKQNIKFNTTKYSILSSANELTNSFGAFQVYPNPANDIVNVDLITLDPTKEAHVSLLDITGRVISKSVLENTSGHIVGEINVSQIPSGIYFVRIESNGTSLAKKIVIN